MYTHIYTYTGHARAVLPEAARLGPGVRRRGRAHGGTGGRARHRAAASDQSPVHFVDIRMPMRRLNGLVFDYMLIHIHFKIQADGGGDGGGMPAMPRGLHATARPVRAVLGRRDQARRPGGGPDGGGRVSSVNSTRSTKPSLSTLVASYSLSATCQPTNHPNDDSKYLNKVVGKHGPLAFRQPFDEGEPDPRAAAGEGEGQQQGRRMSRALRRRMAMAAFQ